ncbi:DUF3667 domain-containing protein [Flectobacillus sp. BAB-3569]|uniref:DUF3667 domain-containing protein n=1 Tax=Flectobacillus sp. BAB-3569 TaxID=1509483 RepID=UPI000BA3F93E|nr:DUF3667 domain-containing protein [Flectobacillus sp. BAB-3569]PAC30747.1 hypothetical protein BWI92_12065 [Flectobacillus sp. BAB-3569]
MLEENCRNCKEAITGNFCPNCGQRRYKRINRAYVLEEIQDIFVDVNKGFFYSVLKILRNPGKTAREYMEGNRVDHYKPIALTFVLAGISIFVSVSLLNLNDIMKKYTEQQHINSKLMSDIFAAISSYYAILMILLLPVFAFITRIPFKKLGHNYYEHIVMNSYVVSYYTLVSIIVLYPILFLFRQSPEKLMLVSQSSFLILPFILVWFFKGFYNQIPLKKIIIKILAVMALTLLAYILVVIVSTVAFILYGLFVDKAVLEYAKPK